MTARTRRKPLAAAALLVMMISSIAFGHQHAKAAPNSPLASDEVMQAQAPLVDLNEKVERLLQAQPKWRATGYSGSYIDAPTRTYSLYWKGAVPAPVTAILDGAPSEVKTRVFATKYSWGELESAAYKLMKSNAGIVLNVAFADDYSGLIAGVASDVTRLALPVVDIPTTLRKSEPVIPTAARGNDASAWHAGGTPCRRQF